MGNLLAPLQNAIFFTKQIGCTIKDELVRVKFNTVKRLLAETNLSVAAITERGHM